MNDALHDGRWNAHLLEYERRVEVTWLQTWPAMLFIIRSFAVPAPDVCSSDYRATVPAATQPASA